MYNRNIDAGHQRDQSGRKDKQREHPPAQTDINPSN